MKQPIFVYGTLMRGERASYMLDDYELKIVLINDFEIKVLCQEIEFQD